MQYVVFSARRDVPDVYHGVGEWLPCYHVSDVTLHTDVGLKRI
jgi:hypothetical protein